MQVMCTQLRTGLEAAASSTLHQQHDNVWVQAVRTQLRGELEAAAQPFAMVGRVELPQAARAGRADNGVSAGRASRGGPEVYVLAAADVVQEAVTAKQARFMSAGLVLSICPCSFA